MEQSYSRRVNREQTRSRRANKGQVMSGRRSSKSRRTSREQVVSRRRIPRTKRVSPKLLLGLLLTAFTVTALIAAAVFIPRLFSVDEVDIFGPYKEAVTNARPAAEVANDAPEEPTRIRIQFAGDILIHDGPLAAARTGDNTYNFRPFLTHIRPYIDGDLTLANMESPVDARGNNYRTQGWPLFNAPFEILDALQYAGFNHLISSNNHAFDKGFDGLVATAENFERAGIAHTGISVDEDDFNTPTIIDVNGIQIGIVAYTYSSNGLEFKVPDAMLPFAVRRFRDYVADDVPKILEAVEDLRAAGAELTIVSLHWGAEYVDEPTAVQKQIARELGEGGADIIMGHHSHTVQPIEWYYREDGSRSLIIYSLGNFLADQTRLNIPIPRTQFGKLVTLHVERSLEGEITLGMVEILPTLCMRDFTGTTLRHTDDVTVLPLFGGELPEFITAAEVRALGREAYEHVVAIVGAEFIAGRNAED